MMAILDSWWKRCYHALNTINVIKRSPISVWFEKYLERILRTSYSWRKTRSKRHNSSIHFHRIIIYIACYHNETNIFFYIFSSFPGSFLTKKNFRAVHPIIKFQPQNYKPKIYNPFRLATWKPLKLGLILRLRGVILDVYSMHKERYGWPFITSKRLLPWIQTSLMLT